MESWDPYMNTEIFGSKAIANVKNVSEFRDQYLGSFKGIRVTVDKNMTEGAWVMRHDNEAVVSPAMFARLQKQIQKRMDDSMLGTLAGDLKSLDPIAIKEQEQMENTELWGVF